MDENTKEQSGISVIADDLKKIGDRIAAAIAAHDTGGKLEGLVQARTSVGAAIHSIRDQISYDTVQAATKKQEKVPEKGDEEDDDNKLDEQGVRPSYP